MDTFPSPLPGTAPFLVLAALVAYLIGSLPTGAMVARLYSQLDLTLVGSERTGATNAMRAMGIGAGLIVLTGDLAKGALAVWVAQQVVGTPLAIGLAGFLSVVGHNRSAFLRGRGGRGVATGLGGLGVASTGIFIVASLMGCIIAARTRYISLGSICGSAAAMIAGLLAYVWDLLPGELALYIIATAAFIIAAHRDNIVRLRARTERQIGK